MTSLDTCDTPPIHSPLLTSTAIDFICILLQLSLIIFTIYHRNKEQKQQTNSSNTVLKLCLVCQFVGLWWILHSTCLSELDPLLQFNKSLILCQMAEKMRFSACGVLSPQKKRGGGAYTSTKCGGYGRKKMGVYFSCNFESDFFLPCWELGTWLSVGTWLLL